MFILAKDLNKTVEELTNNLTLEEFNYWIEFYQMTDQQRKEIKCELDEEFRKKQIRQQQALAMNAFNALAFRK